MFKTLLAALVCAATGSALAQPIQPLQPRDIFALEAASDPQISPDGQYIAYVRRSNDIATDQSLSAIWLINPDGSDHRALPAASGSSHTPRWSPDSQKLAYIQPGADHVSIRVLTLASGVDREVAQVRGGAAGLGWSPDGDRLAYAGFVGEAGMAAADLPEREDDMTWAAGAQIENRLAFRFDGIGALPIGRQQLFVVDIASGEPRAVTSDTLGASGDLAWAADGQSILFAADRRPDRETLAPDSEIFRVGLVDSTPQPLTSRVGPDMAPRPSPDGSLLAYLGYDDHRMGYDNIRLYVAHADGSDPRALSETLDRSVSNPQWSSDGEAIYVQYEDHGETLIALIGLDGSIETLARGLGGPDFGRPYTGGEFTVSQQGRFAATISTPRRPAELATGTRGEALHALTRLNADLLDNRSLSDAETVHWSSPFDGREIEGWVLYPPEFDPTQQYPLILEIHGGPFTAYGPAFSAELQLMAAAGYVVIYTNPRGSTSYGYEFANLIHHDYPGNDYDDLIGAVEMMLDRGFIDSDRLFVTGGSGGGVLTAWIIGNTNRFAAAAVVKPVINWSSFVLYSDLPQFFYRYWFASAPWEDPAEYWRRSPLSLVGNVDTPTLVMVGSADARTPRGESEQYYSALRLRGIPSRLVVIPDAYHGISNSRPSRLLTKVAEILRWFETHDPGLEAVEP
ncbi:S9 family peptidase [Maricaulis salignorans]|uniref:Acyl-peptide hydrolase n=1 Tax=Maricaulis salignorans TaxID=144026 RepID=A0A1G9VPL3_9PROT|nr:S9 family peptidase [Maricaulis salignorans]SDM74158.1 Dipeptidyl aminopeptidase/acylaminoacyl peptidase [Maricaulis salignorans]